MKFLRPDIAVGSCARIAFAVWLTWVLVSPPHRPGPSRQNPSPPDVASSSFQAPPQAKSLAFALPADIDRGDDPLEMDEDDEESSRQLLDPREVWLHAPLALFTSRCPVPVCEPPPPLAPARLRC